MTVIDTTDIKSIRVKAKQAIRLITAAIKAHLVPFLKGSPGCGKSQIIHQIAAAYNLKVIDLRLSQCDPTDLAGFPTIEGSKADYVPMKHFPIEGDPLPKHEVGNGYYDGWLLFLDEANAAPPAIQAAAYKLTLDHMVGSHHLHKKVAIVLAGNLDTDGAITHPISTALQSRLAHFELVVDAKEWLEWAQDPERGNINFRATSYVEWMPGNLFNFKPDHTDVTFACPRTWEFASRFMNVIEPGDADLKPALASVLGEGVAHELVGFIQIQDQLPKVPDIAKAPETTKVPEEPSILFALTGSIANNIETSNATALMKYVARLPVEFQTICVRETIRRNKPLLGHEAIRKWIAEFGQAMF